MTLTAEFDSTLSASARDAIARAATFAAAHVAPNAKSWEYERRQPVETLRAACAAGLHTLELDPRHGGQGLPFSCKMRAVEEISRHDMGFAFSLINHHNALTRFARDGQPSIVARLLPRMLTGEVIGCAGLTEPWVGSDFASIRTSARRVDGGWRIDGAKAWITNAANCGMSQIYAQTDPSLGHRGIACFVVEADRPGFVREPAFELHGGHAIGAGGFRLEGYVAPEDALIAPPGQAFKMALAGINGARTYVAAMCCGMLEASIATAVKYGAGRPLFGGKVMDFQGQRWSMVDALNDLEAMRLLTYRAARLIDAGADAQEAAAHAKKFAGDRTVAHIAACVQAMGANGLRADYPLMRHLSCAKIACYTDGSTEIQNERLGQVLMARFGV
ncbi:MAG: acyl-CoA dehydrogenase family protein [Rhodospirillales bacterium]|nr:MAG: acyl-CoA dehydrogenase family protein [Rhodospirillales bacterium]